MCKRTKQEALQDYKELIIFDQFSEIPEEIKAELKGNSMLFAIPDESIYDEYFLPIELCELKNNKYSPIKKTEGEHIVGRVCLCHVCAGILGYLSSMHDDKVSHEELERMVFVLKKEGDKD